MKAEKMIVEIERTGNERRGSRLSAYRDQRSEERRVGKECRL